MEEKNIIKIAHKNSKVFPNNRVFVNSQELGNNSQINDVKKISKNLSFSSWITVLLSVLYDITLEDNKIVNIKGKFEKFNLILGKNSKKNWGEGKII